ncbi:MAG: sulfatase [Draconibacterium sp.]|nr:sulfatase [Draconibacterium sp.]
MKKLIGLLLIVLTTFSFAGEKKVNLVLEKQRDMNILMITTHDLGQHLGCYGIETVNTPNINRLADKGIMFRNFYSTSAVCSPGRASLHTARYPQSNGLMGLIHSPWWWSFNENEKHTAQLLKNVGYRTILVGFNHVGKPTKLGYNQHLSVKNKAEDTVYEVCEFLKKESETNEPFFLKAGFTEVHRPFDYGSDSTKGIFVPEYLANTKIMRDDLAQFQAEIKYFDSCVGRILKALDDSKIAENTLVIFTADHGIPYPGSKWAARKAGLEVPFIIYKKGEKAFSGGHVYDEVMSNVDVLPTLFDYLGIAKPKNFEGVSFWDFLNKKVNKAPRTEAFGQYTSDMKRDNESRTVITEKYQLIYYFNAGRSVKYPANVNPVEFARHRERCSTTGTRPFIQLYDIQKDPYELHNLSKNESYKEIIETLTNKLYNWMHEVNDPILKGPIASPYYTKAMQNLNEMIKNY